MKITPQSEKPELLTRLKQLLQQHPGPVATVLFYEQQQKLLALSDAYRIKPSPTLFSEMEQMLGEVQLKSSNGLGCAHRQRRNLSGYTGRVLLFIQTK